ncbi:zinc-ribbon domain-containing protein [Butyrivibrio fibrisolvens]|uniref:zinc-ribbon domain-containing protein n=1 Tax=Butyrivibrio fibrisolvens TaxID=831 RepID=UPI0003B4CA09|nr:zinc-ribbon domain-containing protein [Butyrivibrio fibrisolvens]
MNNLDMEERKQLLKTEWDVEKNVKTFDDVSMGSNYIAWWKCSAGHCWKASVKSRTQGRGCPFCAGRMPIAGKNDLLTSFPDVAREWDYEKNRELKPSEVLPFSHKKVWWVCKEGHSWLARVADRANGSGCPRCDVNLTLASTRNHQTDNDYSGVDETGMSNSKEMLDDTEFVKEWDYKKNQGLNPAELTCKSGKKVWWKCSKGHEWQASIINRVQKKTRCPYCAGKKVISGLNDLKTLYPHIAVYWDVEKNEISADKVSPMSHRKVYWKCPSCGKAWMASISSMHYKVELMCPFCNKNKHRKSVGDK